MYLPLAEKLMDKYFLDNDVDAEAGKNRTLSLPPSLPPHPSFPLNVKELFFNLFLLPVEVRLYLMVLDKTHNVEKKLEVLCGAVGMYSCISLD